MDRTQESYTYPWNQNGNQIALRNQLEGVDRKSVSQGTLGTMKGHCEGYMVKSLLILSLLGIFPFCISSRIFGDDLDPEFGGHLSPIFISKMGNEILHVSSRWKRISVSPDGRWKLVEVRNSYSIYDKNGNPEGQDNGGLGSAGVLPINSPVDTKGLWENSKKGDFCICLLDSRFSLDSRFEVLCSSRRRIP